MTTAAFKAIITKVGIDNVLAVYVDNDKVEYYKFGTNAALALSDIMSLGGEDVLKCSSKLRNKKTGAYDIPVSYYIPVEDIQGVLTLDDAKYLDKIEGSALYFS